MRLHVTTIKEEETKELYKLFKRKKHYELLHSLVDQSDVDLFKRLLSDINESENLYNNYWNKITSEYKLSIRKGYKFQIEFKTNKIYLIKI